METRYLSATASLVDSLQAHELLEALLERSKPPLPAMKSKKHDLLSAPFRYRPRTDSRFRPAGQRGLWYGARHLPTACAEVAWWRSAFIRDSEGLQATSLMTQHTFFAARIQGRGIDLMAPPWLACRALWTDAVSYAHTHQLGRAVQDSTASVICYESVRAPGAANIAVFTPDALFEPRGGLDASRQQWACTASGQHAMMRSEKDPAQQLEWRWS